VCVHGAAPSRRHGTTAKIEERSGRAVTGGGLPEHAPRRLFPPTQQNVVVFRYAGTPKAEALTWVHGSKERHERRGASSASVYAPDCRQRSRSPRSLDFGTASASGVLPAGILRAPLTVYKLPARPTSRPKAVLYGIFPSVGLFAGASTLRLKLLRRPLELFHAAQADPEARRDLKQVYRFQDAWEVGAGR
jgi:hypothetical protein